MSKPTVRVEQGHLLGKTSTNIYNENFYSFLGIPYAKPPLGNLRFKAPQQPEPWSGIRDATIEGSPCYARNMIQYNIIGAEDCLFLNVFTPELPKEENPKLLPVMVWIHGGGFRYGSSNSDLYGPQYLLTEDVVLVSINYRLGILGFLSLEDSALEVYGNAGLKDMVLALKWVQKNISKFCGNPENVTIFGESAGAAAVNYLLLSPLATGLFHKAIIQSGCALNSFARGRRDLAKVIATVLEIPETNDKNILALLLKMPMEKLFELSENVLKFCDPLNNPGRLRVYAPVIEKQSPEAFITEDPIKIIKNGNYNKVPVIFGYNTAEGMLIEIQNKPKKPTMPGNFEGLIPFWLEVDLGTDESKLVAKKIKQFYYNKPGLEDNAEIFHQLHTDNYFVRDILCAAYNHATTSPSPVYLYRMSIETSLNFFKKLGGIKVPGVSHGDDIGYLFKIKAMPDLKPGSLEELSVKRFVKYWTNFAKSGNPNSDDESEGVEWKPVSKDKIYFIDIGEEIIEGENPEFERMKFWNEICSLNSLYVNDIYQ